MYVILVYDVGQKRVGKMLKLCRRYLNWIQNSVLEGELSEVQLRRLKHEAAMLMDPDDSLIVFTNKDKKWLDKEVIGREKNELGNIL
jgi:CRISPR-associated protein Cas2